MDAADNPTNFVKKFVAPAGASVINYQVYLYHPAGHTGGSVFWDDMEFYQLLPVTNITTSVSGNNLNLTFSTQGGSVYSVLYKKNLTDTSWSVLTNGISGTGAAVTVRDLISGSRRFYRVQTQ